MKVWVAIWHHKHGTNVYAATNEYVAKKVMAEVVLDALDTQRAPHDVQERAHAAFTERNFDTVFKEWKESGSIEDHFEFIETDLFGASD